MAGECGCEYPRKVSRDGNGRERSITQAGSGNARGGGRVTLADLAAGMDARAPVERPFASVTTHLRGYGVVTLCRFPCAEQERRVPADAPAYMAAAHEHERGQVGAYVVGVRATAPLTDLVGDGLTGETHYTREAEAREAYESAREWLRTTASEAALRAQKSNRKASATARKVKRSIEQPDALAHAGGNALYDAFMRAMRA